MDRDELRATQAPIKQRYRDDPGAAVITLHAEGRLGEDVTRSVHTGRALRDAGLQPATGGTGIHACSGDMLLQAPAACAGVTLASVATALGLDVSGTVRADGDLDFCETLGVDKEAPVGFTDIRLSFDLDTAASEEERATCPLGFDERGRGTRCPTWGRSSSTIVRSVRRTGRAASVVGTERRAE